MCLRRPTVNPASDYKLRRARTAHRGCHTSSQSPESSRPRELVHTQSSEMPFSHHQMYGKGSNSPLQRGTQMLHVPALRMAQALCIWAESCAGPNHPPSPPPADLPACCSKGRSGSSGRKVRAKGPCALFYMLSGEQVY